MQRFYHHHKQFTYSAFLFSPTRFCSSLDKKQQISEKEFPNYHHYHLCKHDEIKAKISASELYEQAERDLQIPIAKLLLTMKKQKATFQEKQLPISLVTSAVLATPSPCSCGDVCTCPPILKFTGVNSALHKQIHHSPNSNNSRNSNNDNFVIKGLLKGCAEQNALGSFAASGNNFEQVRGIVICNLVMSSKKLNDDDEIEESSASCSSSCCCFPCSACRNYLYKVRTDFVSKRHKNQILKLSCISLKLEVDDHDHGHDEMKSSGKNNTKQVVSLECMEGWNTSFREEIIRI